MLVLGFETSCDETGLALYDTERGLLADVLHSQVDLHALYGGVVPELASRDHARRLVPLARRVLAEAGVGVDALDGVAYTVGPGLAGALMSGALAGRALAWALGKPALGVHHMEGHLLSPMLEAAPPPFPFICLLVSGGHTEFVHVAGVGRYRRLGGTIDDAAGEAFDKTAKLLGLPYPGGAALSRLAGTGDATEVRLPRPMLDRPGLDLSFSGLKTAAITRFRDDERRHTDAARFAADLAAGFEAAVVDVLVEKTRRAMDQEAVATLVVAGGVSANKPLRIALAALASERGGLAYCPRLAFCTDNGAMIALAGALRLAAGEQDGLDVQVRPRWPLDELAPIA